MTPLVPAPPLNELLPSSGDNRWPLGRTSTRAEHTHTPTQLLTNSQVNVNYKCSFYLAVPDICNLLFICFSLFLSHVSMANEGMNEWLIEIYNYTKSMWLKFPNAGFTLGRHASCMQAACRAHASLVWTRHNSTSWEPVSACVRNCFVAN